MEDHHKNLHEFFTKHLLDSIKKSQLLSACTILPPAVFHGDCSFVWYDFSTRRTVPYKQKSLPRLFLFDSPSLSTPEGRQEFEFRVFKYIRLLVQTMESQVLARWPSFPERGASHCISSEPCFLEYGVTRILVEKEGVKKFIRVKDENKLKIAFFSHHPDFLRVSELPIVGESHQYRLNAMYYIYHQDGSEAEEVEGDEDGEDEEEAEAVMTFP
jgi:hypothetical protein